MRKLIPAILLASCLPTLALATATGTTTPVDQPPPHDCGGPHRKGPPPMIRELNLTKEQQQQVRQLMGKQMKAHHDITKKYLDKLPAADKQAMKTELTQSRTESDNAIRALLTPEQQKKFDEQKQKMKQRMKEHKAHTATTSDDKE